MRTPGPDHPITVNPLPGSVSVKFKGVLVAQSDHALELRENGHPPVIYIPRSDIRSEHYERSEHQTHCPYKGDAHYFNLKTNDETAINAVWTYEEPYTALAEIRGHVAFYSNQVTFETTAAKG